MAISGLGKGYVAFSILHFLQFVFAITVCALYGVELDRTRKANEHADGRWVYAEVVGGLSALTAILYCIPFILRFALVWAWNMILFILWIALFGVFASMYIHQDARGNSDIQRLKNAVWVVLVNALLWLVGTFAHFIYWWGHRERRSRFTGRARV
ncbi:hypothetical protein N656DRAFT_773860 [Canariomyces notabilis]|uniref:MARVEL domain-containing protein n=1 Tax=Canariomyces notabilis TaxID=2074819 RepID=A0AAN6TNE6_9PEZI|nr:hypothetical protein N656DRAFT_773860 [Canariomyces arenarius]